MRKFVKNLRFSLGLGAGRTFMSHELNDFTLYQNALRPPGIFPTDSAGSPRFVNWINNAVRDNSTIAPDSYVVSSDTATLQFKGRGFNIPLRASVHYEANRFRIGVGFSFERMSLGDFEPVTFRDRISAVPIDQKSGFMSKYFVMAGYSFFRINDFLFTGDLNVGQFNLGSNFNNALIQHGLYTNVGVTIERELSEYLKLYVRPSFDFKSYSIEIPGTGASNLSVNHSMNAFYIGFGFTYAIPELPRCYHRNCHVQINHPHGNREYRSRMHKIWKWQNPNYGQNNPTLIKYKGKNKKKLNPY